MTYTALLYLEDDGTYSVRIPGNPNGCGCVSWGRDLEHARVMIRDALALCLDDEAAAQAAQLEERFVTSYEEFLV